LDQQTGSVTEPSNPSSYWLGPDSTSNAFFVVDMGSVVPIATLNLYQTSNSLSNDRGTLQFNVYYSNSVISNSVNANWGQTLASPTQISLSVPAMVATGGVQTGSLFAFATSGTFTVTTAGFAEILMVAGGGAGTFLSRET
jgi:hypothetical protein